MTSGCPVCADPRVAVVDAPHGSLCSRHLVMVAESELLLLPFDGPGDEEQLCKRRRVWGPNWGDA